MKPSLPSFASGILTLPQVSFLWLWNHCRCFRNLVFAPVFVLSFASENLLLCLRNLVSSSRTPWRCFRNLVDGFWNSFSTPRILSYAMGILSFASGILPLSSRIPSLRFQNLSLVSGNLPLSRNLVLRLGILVLCLNKSLSRLLLDSCFLVLPF